MLLATLALSSARPVIRRAIPCGRAHAVCTTTTTSPFSSHAGLSAAARNSGKPLRHMHLHEATSAEWTEVVDALSPFTTDSRLKRLHEVLDRRRAGVHVVLENVADPHNVAAILRTAEGLGIQHIHAVESISPFIPGDRYGEGAPAQHMGRGRGAANNVAMGAARWLTLERYQSSEDCYTALRELGVQILSSDCPPAETGDENSASSAHGAGATFSALPIDELDLSASPAGVALVFGNERRGVSKAFLDASDATFFLPMSGLTQSFNISVAAAMTLYAIVSSGVFPEGRLSMDERMKLLGRWLLRDIKAAKPLLAREARIEFTDF
jgi:tRNA (guanosine-2'-O-)-methyltransferase